ncbi:MAG: bifunctional helix-turn-helix domain-containing protein/methylated-DNA--[protein]-cysteine S-methyltransferase [Spirochaetales bacterium]|nr:bifunctional helix-turn-helix domain-containing protein/methylated-DNA--[protein]-cysteine S-methyltransferase [Spirochaetales bacterium]
MPDTYYAIEKVLTYLDNNPQDRPGLIHMAEISGMPAPRFEKAFQSLTGASPYQFLDIISNGYTKPLLDSMSVINSSLSSGLSDTGRHHDTFVHLHSATQEEVRSGGKDLEIWLGTAPGPFGNCLIASTQTGISHLFFLDKEADEHEASEGVRKTWPQAYFYNDNKKARSLADRIFSQWNKEEPFHVHIKGTEFQTAVWKALLTIPEGSVTSYARIAHASGNPAAVRAAAAAVAANPVSYLIPCHRVIASNGSIHHYRWGRARKQIILGRELSAAGI